MAPGPGLQGWIETIPPWRSLQPGGEAELQTTVQWLVPKNWKGKWSTLGGVRGGGEAGRVEGGADEMRT